MRRLVRQHAGWLWGTFLGAAGVASLLVIFIPQLPQTMERLWFVAWIWVPISIGFAIRLFQINDGQFLLLKQKEQEIAALSAAEERASEAESELKDLRTELADAHSRIAQLAKLNPTDRDLQLFARVMDEWPWNGETLWWLENVFNAKSWSSSLATQVVIYADVERETFFDDSTVDASYQEFKRACHKLSIWLTSESFSHPQNSDIQEIPDGNRRSGGWKEFDATRNKGRRLADAVINARRDLERTGRSQGL